MVILKQKTLTLLVCLAVVFSFVPHSTQALTYNEIVKGQGGKVLGDTTSSYPYPSSSLVNDNGTIYFICGRVKIPFTNYQAFRGLGYSLDNVVDGDLSGYTPAKTYFITTSQAEHPWCSWLNNNGTIYYSHESGLIPITNWDVFVNNGGDVKYLVRPNAYDIRTLNSNRYLPILENNDSRVYLQPQSTVSNPQPTAPIVAPSPVPAPVPTSTAPILTVPISRPPSITGVRSTTYYDFPYGGAVDLQWGAGSQFRQDLTKDITSIKQNGFDTVWLVLGLGWVMNSDGTINTNKINDVKSVLDILRQNNIKVVLPLDYNIRQEKCSILTDPQKYKEFVKDNETFLRAIQGYSDMVYIVTFTESVWGCTDVGSNYPTPAGGEKLSKLIQSTLGRLPVDLPSDIRAKFIFGFHDGFMSEGWNHGTSAMYIGQNSYDFFSFANYDNSANADTLRADIDVKINRIKSFLPNIPLFSGETGSGYCAPATESQQAAALNTMASYLISKGVGFNIWQWKPINFRDSDSTQKDCAFGGNAITNPDGSLKAAAQSLRALLTAPTPVAKSTQNITSSNVVTSYQPWAVSVTALGLDVADTVRLLDVDGKVWTDNVSIALAGDKTWMSFQLPINFPPSRCNIGKVCSVKVQIVTPASSSVAYNPFSLDLPAFGSAQNITSSNLVTSYQPWAVGVTAPNLESSFTVRLLDTDGKVWAENIPIALAGDKTWMSFQLPVNFPPSKCNIGKSCTISAQIITPSTSSVIYNSFNINLSATGSIHSITSASVTTTYQPWAVGVTAPSLDVADTVRLLDVDGKVWTDNIPIALASDKTWMSFQLPGNIPPSQCNVAKSCTISAQIVAPAALPVIYNIFFINLPAVN